MRHDLQAIVNRRKALEQRIRLDRAQFAVAVEALAPIVNVANRAASIARFLREHPLVGLIIGSATSILLRKRVSRWLPVASFATLAARALRAMLRR